MSAAADHDQRHGTFVRAMRQLAGLPDTALVEPRTWPAHPSAPLNARYALYIALGDEQAAAVEVPRPTRESERILVQADRAMGDLCGLLAGCADSSLDASPVENEWSLREVLVHVLRADRRYAEQVARWWLIDHGDVVRLAFRLAGGCEAHETGIAA